MRPVLVVNPRSDESFVNLAEDLVGEADSPAELQAALRKTYPRTVVRQRVLAGEPTAVWYVYREGSWTPGTPTET
jgi:hypothetical protein